MKTLLLATGLAAATLASTATSTPTADGCSSSKSAAWVAEHATLDIVDTAIEAGSFKTLAAALKAADLVDALKGDGPFTVFAPTDEAFARLPKGTLESLLEPENRATLTTILTYHVVPGSVPAKKVVKSKNLHSLNGQRVGIHVEDGAVTAAGSGVVKTDIECTNGIIHVVDTVMLPSTMDVVATAIDAGSFTTLAQALQAAALVETLQGDGPFTVFAPSDEAFAKLPEHDLASLLKPENRDKLTSILTYHVVSGRVYSDQLESGHVKTLQGHPFAVKVGEHGVMVNDARVVSADIETTNGVIHVIDTVLMPR